MDLSVRFLSFAPPVEQHYASNIQKNQLVQRDIRIAKKLQDVEEEESRLQASEEQKQM